VTTLHEMDGTKKSPNPSCLFSGFILSLKILNLFAICIGTAMQVKQEASLLRKIEVQICL